MRVLDPWMFANTFFPKSFESMEPVERGSGGGRNSRHTQKKIGRVSNEEGLPN